MQKKSEIKIKKAIIVKKILRQKALRAKA